MPNWVVLVIFYSLLVFLTLLPRLCNVFVEQFDTEHEESYFACLLLQTTNLTIFSWPDFGIALLHLTYRLPSVPSDSELTLTINSLSFVNKYSSMLLSLKLELYSQTLRWISIPTLSFHVTACMIWDWNRTCGTTCMPTCYPVIEQNLMLLNSSYW